MGVLFATAWLTVAALCGAICLYIRPGRVRRALATLQLGADVSATTSWSPGGVRVRSDLPFPFTYLNTRMRRGGVELELQSVVIMTVLGACAGWAAMRLLVGGGLVADLASFSGLVVPAWWIDKLASNRRERIALEMEQIALALEGAAGAGMTPYEALVHTAPTLGGVMGPEVRRVLMDAASVGLSEALIMFRARMTLPEVRLLVAGLRLHQGAGAATAGALSALAHTLRERREAVMAIRTATLSSAMQANMLIAIPPALLILLRAVYPSFLRPLVDTATGQWVVALCAVWMLLGYYMIRRMVDPHVVL